MKLSAKLKNMTNQPPTDISQIIEKMRMALMFDDDKKEFFVMVDHDLITEGIWNFDGKWEGGMCMSIRGSHKWHHIASFKEWWKLPKIVIEGRKNETYSLDENETLKLKQAVIERDKRIKLICLK